MPGGERSEDAIMTHRGQCHRGNAAAAFAVRISAKLAWGDVGAEVGGDHAGGSREDACCGVTGRRFDFANEAFRHFEGGVFHSQLTQIGDNCSSLRSIENFGVGGAPLRGKSAEPHFHNFRTGSPEAKELIEVAGTSRDL